MTEERDQPGAVPAQTNGGDGPAGTPAEDVRPGARDDTTATTPGDAAVPPASIAKRTGRHMARRIITWVLIVLACLVVATSISTFWTNLVLFDTSRFISVVAPIVRSPAVAEGVSERAAAQIVTALDIQGRAQAALPDRAGFLAVTAAAGAERYIERLLEDLLSTERIQEAWINALRFVHDRIVAILRGDSRFLILGDGTVSLNLFPLIEAVLQRLEGTGLLPDRFVLPDLADTSPDEARQQLSAALGRPLPADFGVVEVADAPTLQRAQDAVETFDTLTYVLPVPALLLAAGALLVSTNRRRTLIALGVGIAAAIVLVGLVAELGAREAVNAVRDRPAAYPVSQAAVDSLTDNLWSFLRPAIALSLAVAAAAWLWGRRDWLASVAGGQAGAADGRRGWVARNADALRLGGLGVAVVALLLVNLTWGTLLLILALLVLYLIIIAVLGRQADRGGPDALPATPSS
jgi:hypothetical protein